MHVYVKIDTHTTLMLIPSWPSDIMYNLKDFLVPKLKRYLGYKTYWQHITWANESVTTFYQLSWSWKACLG